MKVAVIQFKASTKKDENLKKIISYVKKAASKDATLCAFPEFMMLYTKSSQTYPSPLYISVSMTTQTVPSAPMLFHLKDGLKIATHPQHATMAFDF